MDKKQLLIYDIPNQRFVDTNGNASRDRVKIIYDDLLTLCIRFVEVTTDQNGENTLTAIAISEMVFAVFGDSDYDPETAYLFLTEQSAADPDHDGINDAGDWIDGGTADPVQGQLSARINSKTRRFSEALASGARECRLVITGIPAGTTQPVVLLLASVDIVNRPTSDAGAPEPSNPDYYTAAQIDALLAAGFVIRYSEAGGDDPGHDVPTDADYYYRFRAATAPDSAPWTDWVKFRGRDGVDGNTFEVVESAEPPTVTTEGAFVLWHKTEA